jgi:hypothetical protein
MKCEKCGIEVEATFVVRQGLHIFCSEKHFFDWIEEGCEKVRVKDVPDEIKPVFKEKVSKQSGLKGVDKIFKADFKIEEELIELDEFEAKQKDIDDDD